MSRSTPGLVSVASCTACCVVMLIVPRCGQSPAPNASRTA
jgi:hypothetical protein